MAASPDRDGGIDWLHFSKDVEQIMAEVVGDGRHDPVRPQDLGVAAARAAAARCREWQDLRVLAHAEVGAGKGAELVRRDAGAFVRGLKTQPGKTSS